MVDEFDAAEVLLKRREARRSLAGFSRYLFPDEPPAAHHELLCNALDEVLERVRLGTAANYPKGEWQRDRLMVFMPPGSAKSTYSSVRFPGYFLGKLPTKAIICASYGEKLATEFGRKVRNIVKREDYLMLFDVALSEDAQAKGEWGTNHGGSYFAAGVGSGVTGRRADLGLIDDPVKGQQEADSISTRDEAWNWYRSDFFSRLKPGAAQIIIQTRWNDDDLSGRILPDDWDGTSGDFVGFDGQIWRVICLPAEARDNDILGREQGEWLWPDYYTPATWESIKKVQTSDGTDFRIWNALYQQTPQPDSGVFFKREWFKRYDLGDHPPVSPFGASDYGVTKGGGDATEHGIGGFDKDENLYLVDWWSGHSSTDEWIESQLDLAKEWRPYAWLAEVGVIRRAVEPFLTKRKRERRIYFRQEWMSHIGDKGANAKAFQALAASGKVYIPRCEWGDAVLDQLVKFVPGTDFKDDKVDVCGLLGRIVDAAFGPREQHLTPTPKKDSYGVTELDVDDEYGPEDEFDWMVQ